MTSFVNNDAWAQGEAVARQKYFPDATDGKLFMKDVMLMSFESGLHRLKASSPDVKVIAMLRDPVARAWSAFHYARSRGVESAVDFDGALKLEAKRLSESKWRHRANLYTYNSTYADKVALLYDIFGEENTLVIFQEEYRRSPEEWLSLVGSLLQEDLFPAGLPATGSHNRAAQARSQLLAKGLAKTFRSRGLLKRIAKAVFSQERANGVRRFLLKLNRVEKANPDIPAATESELRKIFSSDAEQLRALLGHCPWSTQ
jgi:hypothetical protein